MAGNVHKLWGSIFFSQQEVGPSRWRTFASQLLVGYRKRNAQRKENILTTLVKIMDRLDCTIGRVIITFSQKFLLALVFFGAFLCIKFKEKNKKSYFLVLPT